MIDKTEFQNLGTFLNSKVQQLAVRKQTLSDKKVKCEGIQEEIVNTLTAQKIAQTVAEETQRNLEEHISGVVTKAFQAIFDDPYEFRVRFETKRGKTECNLFFVKNEQEVEPLTAAGGGTVDVASFALRCAVWAMKPNRPVFILDEPFRFLSRDLQHKASAMLKLFSETLGVQIILISHIPEIIENADSVIEVVNVNGEAQITYM